MRFSARLEVDLPFTVTVSANAANWKNVGVVFAGMLVIFDVLAAFLVLTSLHPVSQWLGTLVAHGAALHGWGACMRLVARPLPAGD